MDKDIKDLTIMGAIVFVLVILFAGFFCIGHEYGSRSEHKKVLKLINTNEDLHNELHIYEDYFNAAEDLLDTLEKYDNWIDRFDPIEYYDAVKCVRGDD